jgi:hypothetical protein
MVDIVNKSFWMSKESSDIIEEFKKENKYSNFPTALDNFIKKYGGKKE